MKKLSLTEKRLLLSYKPDMKLSDGTTWPGRIWPGEYPKNTYACTVRNLFRRGLIQPARMPIEMMATQLTDDGKRIVEKLNAMIEGDKK